MKSIILGMATVLALLGAAAPVAYAGRTCEDKPVTSKALINALDFAGRTHEELDATGAKAVIIARMGQDLGAYGIRYSHLAIAVRRDEGWRVFHKLNHCGTANASVYLQGLAEFFMDDPIAFETAWVALNKDSEAKVMQLLADSSRRLSMHITDYNMLAYPWSTKYQQSNQFVTETLALALGIQGPRANRDQAQAWLKFQAYEPTELRLGTLTRLGARVSRANIAFDDHPSDKRFSDRIETTTADSVLNWLQRANIGQTMQVLR